MDDHRNGIEGRIEKLNERLDDLDRRLDHVERLVGLRADRRPMESLSAGNRPAVRGRAVAAKAIDDRGREFREETPADAAGGGGMRESIARTIGAGKRLSEMHIGKYVLHAAAVLLVFYAVIAFILFVWDRLGIGGRIGTVELIGAAAVAIGVVFKSRMHTVFTAFMLGAGAGSTYLGIVFAYIWSVVPEYAAIGLVIVWLGLFLCIYRRTGIFFTIITACIGDILALMQLSDSIRDPVGTIVYAAFASATTLMLLLCMTYKREKSHTMFAAVMLCAANAVLSILSLSVKEAGPDTMIGTAALQALLYVVLFVAYGIFGSAGVGSLVYTGIFTALQLLIDFARIGGEYAQIPDISNAILGMAMCFVLQRILKSGEYLLTCMYAAATMAGVLGIAHAAGVRYDSLIVVPMLLLALYGLGLFNINHKAMAFMLTVPVFAGWYDSLNRLLFFGHSTDAALSIAISAFECVVCIGFLLLARRDRGLFPLNKGIGISILLCNMAEIGAEANRLLESVNVHEYGRVLQYGLLVGGIAAIAASGLLKDANADGFRWFHGGFRECQKPIRLYWYLLSMVVYMRGLILIDAYSSWHAVAEGGENVAALYALSVLATLAVMAVQTLVVRHAGWHRNYQILTGLKLSVFVYAALYNNVGGILLSIIGIAMAAAFIWSGFNFRLRGLRLYGLILMIAAVIKAIVMDIDADSLGKILALAVGAALCITTSYMYNKYDKIEKGTDEG
jgi:hypothetical protein